MPRLLRIIVGLGLTGLVFWLADPAAVLRAAAAADLRWILASVLLVIPDRALMAYRWLVLLRAVDPGGHVPVSAVLRVFFVSTFVGTFLPSLGGDAARAYGLSRYGVPVAESAASVVMDRVVGVWSLLLMALPGLLLTRVGRHDTGILTALAIITVASGVAALLLYSGRAAGVASRILSLLPVAFVRRAAERLLEAVRRYRHHHDVMLNVTVGSLAVQVIRVLQSYCIGRALGIPLPVTIYFALIPLILIVLLVPVTINGLGTGQLAFVWLFGVFGVAPAQSFALSILAISLGVVGNLPGGFVYAFGRERLSAPPARETAPPRLL